MDHFGIGTGLRGAAQIYFRSGRRTGRTTSLIESLKDGDRVCCVKPADQDLRRKCRERGLNVEIIVVDPRRPEAVLERAPAAGRTLFDHSWVEAYFIHAIERASESIDHLQQKASGPRGGDLRTERHAEEVMRWA